MLLENERIDDLHRNNYKIIQNTKGFCFGQDAVLLSGFAKVRKGEKVLDLCTGTGIIPILLEAKTEGSYFAGIEIQPQCAAMAKRSVELNNLNNKVDIIEGDINKIEEYFLPQCFDVVTCNPPYMKVGTGAYCDNSPKALARHEILCNIDDVFKAANKVLKFGGRLYMVHRPERLVDIFYSARSRAIEPKTLRLVVPYEGKEPNIVLIEFVKGGKAALNIKENMIIYNSDNSYTDEVRKIYYE